MNKILNVYLFDYLVGEYSQEVSGQMRFKYDEIWLNSPDSYAISCSLPLKTEAFDNNDCQAFFGGILPEGDQRTKVAKNLGISEKNDFSMLKEIGGEVIGALTFIEKGQKLPAKKGKYLKLTKNELARLIKSLPQKPLLAGQEGVRMSMAGAQAKVSLRILNGKYSIPLGSSSGTHIIKPAIPGFQGIVGNEAYCLKLASKCGLITAEASEETFEDTNFLLIKRFDRGATTSAINVEVARFHQEDFCQARGISSLNKYQNEGGPGFKDCFSLVRKVSNTPALDILQLLDIAVFNLVIGNNDAHAKNFSLLYSTSQTGKSLIRLSPFYDLICTVIYPDLSPKMAMKFGSEYHFEKLQASDFDKFAADAGVTATAFKKRANSFCKKLVKIVTESEDQTGIEREITQIIRTRGERMLEILEPRIKTEV